MAPKLLLVFETLIFLIASSGLCNWQRDRSSSGGGHCEYFNLTHEYSTGGSSDGYFDVDILLLQDEWRPFCDDSILMDSILESCSRKNVRVWWKNEPAFRWSNNLRGCLGSFFAQGQKHVGRGKDAVLVPSYPDFDASCIFKPLRCASQMGVKLDYPTSCVRLLSLLSLSDTHTLSFSRSLSFRQNGISTCICWDGAENGSAIASERLYLER